jgi:hypothetical protein
VRIARLGVTAGIEYWRAISPQELQADRLGADKTR